MKASEIRQQWLDSDKDDVEAFNADYRYQSPPLEMQVAFLRLRLQKTMSVVGAILELLAVTEGASDR